MSLQYNSILQLPYRQVVHEIIMIFSYISLGQQLQIPIRGVTHFGHPVSLLSIVALPL